MDAELRKEKIKSVWDEWLLVQARVKQAEQISPTALLPAINELRYAGRTLTLAFATEFLETDLDPSNKVFEEFELTNSNIVSEDGIKDVFDKDVPLFDRRLIIARQYIRNADGDVSDALLYFFQSRVDSIEARFGAGAIIAKFPEFKEMIEKLRVGRELVILSRKTPHKRLSCYSGVKEVCDYLIENYFLLTKTDVFFAVEVDKLKDDAKRWRRTFWFLLGVSIFLAAICAYLSVA